MLARGYMMWGDYNMRCTSCGADMSAETGACARCGVPIDGDGPAPLAGPAVAGVPTGYPQQPVWGYPPAGYVPPYYAWPRRVQGIGTAVIVTTLIYGVLAALGSVLSLAGSSVGYFAADLLGGFVEIVLVVVFLVWFNRVVANSQPWGAHRLSSRWTVWSWFVPVVFLWFPYKIATDCARASARDPRESARLVLLIRLWWAALILSVISPSILDGGSPSSTDGSFNDSAGQSGFHAQIHHASAGQIVGTVISLIAAYLLVLVVRGVNAAQNSRLGYPAPR